MKIIDMHCDTIHKIWKATAAGENKNLADDVYMLNIPKMEKGGYSVQNFAMFIEAYDDIGESNIVESSIAFNTMRADKEKAFVTETGKRIDCFQRFEELYKVFINQMNLYSDRISIVTNAKEILANEREGRLSALLTVEGGEACVGDVDKLSYLYDKGVRMMTLTWNYINELGYPNINGMRRDEPGFSPFIPDTEHGLTGTGIEFVKAMEDMGMIVDVSHLSDAGFYDVYNNTKKPFVASHSNAREVCPFVRNLTDDMIRMLGKRGGVTGLNYCRDFLFTSAEEKEIVYDNYLDITCNKLAEHARHIVNVGGMGVLGLGSDFDGIHAYVGMPKADKMDHLANALHKNGFTEGQIDDIFYGNVMRVYSEVL